MIPKILNRVVRFFPYQLRKATAKIQMALPTVASSLPRPIHTPPLKHLVRVDDVSRGITHDPAPYSDPTGSYPRPSTGLNFNRPNIVITEEHNVHAAKTER